MKKLESGALHIAGSGIAEPLTVACEEASTPGSARGFTDTITAPVPVAEMPGSEE
ncbi:MAG: hypothetical protein WBN71_08770 [Acidimicrobiia bacterium]|jgi:hypothetical protein